MSSTNTVKLSKWGLDVAANTCTRGNHPGDFQPEACAGCLSTARMNLAILADGLRYWVCPTCGYVHESENSQGKAHGMSAYANKFKVGDFVRRAGSWIVFRVDTAHRSDSREGGYFSATQVIDGSKYHEVGKKVFEHADYYILVEDAQAFVEGHGYKFVPDAGKK
jgi:hypothetical protein